MARPKKDESEKRENRLTVYLTDDERDTLATVAEQENRAMTQVVIVAVKEWINRLMNPPELLKQAKYEKIMQTHKESLLGYICRNGHPFWIEWASATGPRFCPVCGSEKEIKRAWDGTIQRR